MLCTLWRQYEEEHWKYRYKLGSNEDVRSPHMLHKAGVKFFGVSIDDSMRVLPEELHLAAV